MSTSTVTSPTLRMEEEILSGLRQLLELSHRKQALLLERRHASLPEVLAELEKAIVHIQNLKAAYEGEAGEERVAELYTSSSFRNVLAELQKVNETNARLVDEQLAAIKVCLELLGKSLPQEYAPARGAAAADSGQKGAGVVTKRALQSRGIINIEA